MKPTTEILARIRVLSERAVTEPYTLRGVRTVPGEGGANLPQQCDKAVLPYSTTFITTPRPLTAPGSFTTSSAPALRCGGSLTGCALSMSCPLSKIQNSTARAAFSIMASGLGKSRPPHNSGCGWPSWRPWGKSPPTFRRSCGSWRSLAFK